MRNKKLVVCLVIAAMLASLLTLFAGCNEPPMKADITNYIANLDGAKGLAIVDPSVLSKTQKVADKNKTSVALATVDDEGQYKEALFRNEKNEQIQLSDKGLVPIKMKVLGDFTYVCYTMQKYLAIELGLKDTATGQNLRAYYLKGGGKNALEVSNYYTPIQECTSVLNRSAGVTKNYDMESYVTYKYAKSYVINNKTGKVYSMNKFERFHIQSENIIYTYENSQKIFHTLSVNSNNDLVATELVPNRDVKTKKVYIANDGYKYVLNENVEMVDKENKIYYVAENINKRYLKDNNGNVYLSNTYNQLTTQIVNGEEQPIASDNIPEMTSLFDRYSDSDSEIEESYLYGVYGYKNGYSISRNKIVKNDDSYRLYTEDGDYNEHIMAFAGKNLEYLLVYDVKAKSLGYINFDWNNFSQHWTTGSSKHIVLDNIVPIAEDMSIDKCYYQKFGEYVQERLFSKITTNGTIRYSLEVGENEINLIATSTKIYTTGVMLIAPLN